MHWDKSKCKYKNENVWFAWYPISFCVYSNTFRTVWLEQVLRRCVSPHNDPTYHHWWEYKPFEGV